MQDYQQRVVDEKNDLDEKITKLSTFIDDEDSPAVPIDEAERLKKQHNIMLDYSDILSDRISAFK